MCQFKSIVVSILNWLLSRISFAFLTNEISFTSFVDDFLCNYFDVVSRLSFNFAENEVSSRTQRAFPSGRKERVSRSSREWSLEKAGERVPWSHLKKGRSLGRKRRYICTVIRPQHVLFVADLVSNGSCLSTLPASVYFHLLPFSPFLSLSFSLPLLYLAALQIHCRDQVWRPHREGRKNRFPLRAGTCATLHRQVKVASQRVQHTQTHVRVAFHLGLAHPGSVSIRFPVYLSDSMILPRWSRKRRLIWLLSPANKQPARRVPSRSGKFTWIPRRGWQEHREASTRRDLLSIKVCVNLHVYTDVAKTAERNKQSAPKRGHRVTKRIENRSVGKESLLLRWLCERNLFLPALERGRWTWWVNSGILIRPTPRRLFWLIRIVIEAETRRWNSPFSEHTFGDQFDRNLANYSNYAKLSVERQKRRVLESQVNSRLPATWWKIRGKGAKEMTITYLASHKSSGEAIIRSLAKNRIRSDRKQRGATITRKISHFINPLTLRRTFWIPLRIIFQNFHKFIRNFIPWFLRVDISVSTISFGANSNTRTFSTGQLMETKRI